MNQITIVYFTGTGNTRPKPEAIQLGAARIDEILAALNEIIQAELPSPDRLRARLHQMNRKGTPSVDE